MRTKSTIAREVAPEDIKKGLYVSALYEIIYVPLFPCFDPSLGKLETAPVRWMPDDPAALLRVEGVCLPFVLVQNACGVSWMIDVRRYRLARVSKAFGEAAFEAFRRNAKARKRRCQHAAGR